MHQLQDTLFLKSWRTLAPQLGLSSSEVEAIEGDAHSERENAEEPSIIED